MIGNAISTRPLAITIAASPIVITTAALPNAALGSGYLQTLAASGGSPPYRWSIAAGNLPAGLALDPSGRISGIAVGATSSFTVQAADSAGASASSCAAWAAASGV